MFLLGRQRMIFHLLIHSPKGHNPELRQPEARKQGSLAWVQGHKAWDHPLLFFQAVSREQDQNWSVWDMNWCPFEMPSLTGKGLAS